MESGSAPFGTEDESAKSDRELRGSQREYTGAGENPVRDRPRKNTRGRVSFTLR
jgi:hypothetical protein